MKKSVIPWHVFREALEGQDPEVLEQWLGRWGFTNDGVVLIGVDPRSGPQVLWLERRHGSLDAVAVNFPASLHELVQLLTRDPSLLMEEATKLLSCKKEL
jgi:hypothetical protein